MKRLHNIDALKLVCAVLVVFIHVVTPYSEFVEPITRCAVPCFFIISGYLIFNVDKEKLEWHLRRGIKRTFLIMAWSTALFAVVKFAFAFWRNDFSFLNSNTLWKFVFLNENPFWFHLWYIGAYLYTLTIVIFAVKKNRLKLVYQAVPLLLLVNLCFGKYSIVLWHREFPLILFRNFLFVGIPYFAIGMLIKQYKDIILNSKRLHLLALGGGILFSLTSLLEKYVLTNQGMNATGDLYISSTFLGVSMFLFFLTFRQSKPNFLSTSGERDSLYIYIYHPLFMTFFSAIKSCTPVLWQEFYVYWSPVVILITTVVFTKILRTSHIIK